MIYAVKRAKRMEYANAIECLVIDEGSNVDQSLMADIISCFPRLSRLIIVMDPWQINPISPGTPAKDLLALFPEHTFSLTKNLRVAPSAIRLADAVQTRTLSPDSPIILLEQEASAMAIVLHLFSEYEQLQLAAEMPFPCAFQFCTLKRKVRAQLNRDIEAILIGMGHLKPDQYQEVRGGPGLRLYPGQKIKFEKSMSFRLPPAEAAAGKKRRRREPDPFVYHAVRNGEIALVTSMVFREHKWVLGIKDPLVTLTTQPERFIMLDPMRHVDPDQISAGWCITINASQGSQFPMTVAWFHPGYADEPDSYSGDNIWKREHLYVAMSRSRFRTIVVSPGGEAALERLVSQCSRPRDTLVQVEVKQSALYRQGVMNQVHVAADAYHMPPRDELQLMPKEIPCVPVFGQGKQEEEEVSI
jgi:ATP-dependent exoDNAse (exonuclease V) alpha subunit